MNFKLKPLTVALIATSAVLSGCSTEEDKIEKTTQTNTGQVNAVTGVIETAISGLTCQLPDIVQSIDSDFYPLTQDEKDALRALVDPTSTWTDEQVANWNSNDLSAADTAYTYDYGAMNLYVAFANAADSHTNANGLTNEEVERKALAKVEAKAFKVGQKQDVLFGDDFDTWFDDWFESVAYSDYLGASQRIARATRGLELSLSSALDNQEVCYTPPTECPNYKVLDESGKYDCVTPEANPIADVPAWEDNATTGQAVVYFRKNGEQDDANYEGISIHTWNNSNCTAFAEDGDNISITNWGQGKAPAGIDPNYGMYWILDLVDAHDNCGNFILYHKSTSEKYVTQNDAMIPLGNSGDLVFHDLDKRVFFQEGFPANYIDGVYLGNQHPYFGASAGSKSCGWGTVLDEAGEACVGQKLDNCPVGTYAVGEAQIDIASKCVAEFDTMTTTLMIRGGFNNWGDPAEGQEFEYTSDGQYRMNVSYGSHPDGTAVDATSVSYPFKIADADWSEPSTYGSIKDGDVPSVGGTIALTAGEGVGQDMVISFEENKIYQFLLNAKDVSAATLTINEVPVDAFPVLTIGDADHELPYLSNGQYGVEKVALSAGTYTLSIGDSANGLAIGGADGADIVSLDEALPLIDMGSDLTLTIDSDGEFDIVLDYTDVDSPTLLVQRGVPFGSEQVFIRGSMSGWANPAPDADEAKYNQDTRAYSLIYGLEGGGTHEFKFASQVWGGALDLGPDQFDISDDVGALEIGDNGNLTVTPTKSTAYEISISYDGVTKGVLKIQEAPFYIRGGIYGSGDWSADETMRLNFEPTDADNTAEAGHIYSSIVTTNNTGFFKIADAGWGGDFGINFGASAEQETNQTNVIELGVPFQTVSGDETKNISFQAPPGQYRFSFNHETKELTVTAVQ